MFFSNILLLSVFRCYPVFSDFCASTSIALKFGLLLHEIHKVVSKIFQSWKRYFYQIYFKTPLQVHLKIDINLAIYFSGRTEEMLDSENQSRVEGLAGKISRLKGV